MMGYCNIHDAYNGNGHCKWCDQDTVYGVDRAQLMRFYNVSSTNGLIDAMEKHIESLQSGLTKINQRITTKVREG